MKSITFLVLLCIVDLCQATIKVDMSRKEIYQNETVHLVVSIDKITGFEPDFEKIFSPDFEVIKRSYGKKQFNIINGKQSTATSWDVYLQAKTKGKIRIPAFEIDDELSSPLEIMVKDALDVPVEVEENPQLFLKTEVDKLQGYVQEQFILKIRLFRAVELIEAKIDKPNIPDSLVEKLNESNYLSRIRNTDYLVSETNIAFFPQKTGKLTLPSIIFEGYLAKNPSDDFFGAFFAQKGEYKQLISPPITIDVQSIAKSETPQTTWLPAKQLTITDNWPDLPEKIYVGDSLTRTITVKADGLLPSQLPEIELSQLDAAKIYAEKPSTDLQNTNSSIIGVKTQTFAIIPQKSGKLTLPAISIPWWNVKTKHWETANLPEKTVVVLSVEETNSVTDIPQNTEKATELLPHSETITENSISAWLYMTIWFLLTISIISTVLSLIFWRKSRTNRSDNSDVIAGSAELKAPILNKLKQACLHNQADLVFKLLPQWAQNIWPDADIHNFHDVKAHIANMSQYQTFFGALNDLEQGLFAAKDSSTWSGKDFLAILNSIKKTSGVTKKPTELDTLYPKS